MCESFIPPFDVIDMAKQDKTKKFVFLAVGFETTAPIFARAVQTVREQEIRNLFLLTSVKRMPPILRYILDQPGCSVDGLLSPGHVAAITDAEYFRFITDEYGIPAAVCGFEAADILGGIYHLVGCHCENESGFVNQYSRAVSDAGNIRACEIMNDVFKSSDAFWRGIGLIKTSGLTISDAYSEFDAERMFTVVTQKRNVQPCK